MTPSPPSLSTLIADAELRDWIAAIVGQPIRAISVEPLQSVDSASGVPLYRIVTSAVTNDRQFVLKLASANSDWIARATDDHSVREAALVELGIHNDLPPTIVWPVLAAKRVSETDRLLLMRDVTTMPGATLVPSGDDLLPVDQVNAHLTHLAELHSAFADRLEAVSAVPFCSVANWLTMLGPATIERERGNDDPVTPHLLRGWDAFRGLASPAVGDAVRSLLENPTPIVAVLDRAAPTLLHGDFKFGNLGQIEGGSPKTIALDWSQVMWGSPHLDLAWFLAVNSARLPMPKETAIETYRRSQSRWTGDDWDWLMSVALLGGGVLRLAWAKALGASSDDPTVARRERAELDWWLAAAEKGIHNLNLS